MTQRDDDDDVYITISARDQRKMTKVGGGSQLIFIAGENVAFCDKDIRRESAGVALGVGILAGV